MGIIIRNIQFAVENKIIGKDAPLYISPTLVYYLPYLCWNHDLDSFIAHGLNGRYEYIFKDKLNYFSFSEKRAKYKIDEKTF